MSWSGPDVYEDGSKFDLTIVADARNAGLSC
jgi:hypothetical protein